MEEKKRTPWRRWVLLVLLVAGGVLAFYIPPVRPEITLAPDRLIETPLVSNLPLVGDFYLVNTLPTLAVTLLIVIVLAYFTNRSVQQSLKTDLAPRGIGALMETAMEVLYNLTEGSAGSKWAPAIFPWFATFMIYVLLANVLKLIPGFESFGILRQVPTGGHPIVDYGWLSTLIPGQLNNGYVLVPLFRGISVDLNFTLALALISVIMTQVIGMRAQGIGYFSKFFNVRNLFTVPFFGPMDFLVGLLELISELSKILSFTLRLFFNMFAGILLAAMISAMMGIVNIVPAMWFLFELFVALIQAFVFGMLTMVFMSMATVGHGHEEEHHEAAPAETAVETGAEAHPI